MMYERINNNNYKWEIERQIETKVVAYFVGLEAEFRLWIG